MQCFLRTRGFGLGTMWGCVALTGVRSQDAGTRLRGRKRSEEGEQKLPACRLLIAAFAGWGGRAAVGGWVFAEFDAWGGGGCGESLRCVPGEAVPWVLWGSG